MFKSKKEKVQLVNADKDKIHKHKILSIGHRCLTQLDADSFHAKTVSTSNAMASFRSSQYNGFF